MIEKPKLDYRVENWSQSLQLILWVNIVVGFFPRMIHAISEGQLKNFFDEGTYLKGGYNSVAKRFTVDGLPKQ